MASRSSGKEFDYSRVEHRIDGTVPSMSLYTTSNYYYYSYYSYHYYHCYRYSYSTTTTLPLPLLYIPLLLYTLIPDTLDAQFILSVCTSP